MWRMFSCLWCCPRPKLRMTIDSTIPSLQRSSVPSNIQKKIGLSFKFLYWLQGQNILGHHIWSSVSMGLLLLGSIVSYSNLRPFEAICAGTLPVTAQLLPSFLFPDSHVYDPDNISHNVLQGHIMIRVFLIQAISLFYLQFPLGRKASVSRPVNCSWATWCSPWKTRKCIVVQLDNNDSSHDCVCCNTGMSYNITVFSFLIFDIWYLPGTLCYEFNKYMDEYRWAVQVFWLLLANNRLVWRWGGSCCAHQVL